ncbi:MAG: ABC transporter permease [Hydrogenovibrio sp.]|nr:ABC transporter permease [Hydrogenovibrio sp.]
MLRSLSNIFWLGTKELNSLYRDSIMLGLVIFSFSFSIYSQSKGATDIVNNASIAFVDEDRSGLSESLQSSFYPPYFQKPQEISASEIDSAMNKGRYMFVVVIPPNFAADVRQGRSPEIQLNIDATASLQASLGASYIHNLISDKVALYAMRTEEMPPAKVSLVIHRAFNPNGESKWFRALAGLLDQLTMITIILTGAALIREREHGTTEHLMVMPITAFEIAVGKVWANGLVVLVAAVLSMHFIVEGLLDVPIAGSRYLLIMGIITYLFSAAAIGIFLGIFAKSMAQFALLIMLTISPMQMLSGGSSPIENQPEWMQMVTWFLPSRHFMSFAQAVAYRGAGFEIVWFDFFAMTVLGLAFFVLSLLLFRRSMTMSQA